MRHPFRHWFSRSRWFGHGSRERTARRARRRGYLRNISQLESLEPRWLLANQPLDPTRILQDDQGREYADGYVLAALRTPQLLNHEAQVKAFLSDKAMPRGWEGTADDFEFKYGLSRNLNENLAVGEFKLSEGQSVEDAIDALRQLSFVEWAHPDYVVNIEPDLAPNDELFPQQFHHPLIGSPTVWNTTTGSPNVVIAVLDTGVLRQHPDLAQNIWTNPREIPGNNLDDDLNQRIDDVSGWDFANNDSDPSPVPSSSGTDDHGTNVAGAAAARIDNAVGVAGVAGTSQIMPVRVIGDDNGAGALVSRVSDALTYSACVFYERPTPCDLSGSLPTNKHLIINMSFNNENLLVPAYLTALEKVYNAGVLIVQSAGNGQPDNIGDADTARQAFGHYLLVANSNANDQVDITSNFGVGVDLAAPGEAILTTSFTANNPATWNNPASFSPTYDSASGTSLSAPIVAGAAALVWSQNPTFTRDQVVARLVGMADFIDNVPGNTRVAGGVGGGRLNVAKASNASLPLPAPTLQNVRLIRDDRGRVEELALKFSQVLDPTSANLAGNYELMRDRNSDGVFDPMCCTDDTFPISVGQTLTNGVAVHYLSGSNQIRLDPGNTSLPIGNYRLTLRSGGATGLKNPFGAALDGDLEHFFQITSGLGRTGDAITIDLEETLGEEYANNQYFFPGLNYGLSTKVANATFGLLQGTTEIGRIIHSAALEGDPFASPGRFYFMPETHAALQDDDPTTPGFQGTIVGNIAPEGGGLVKEFKITVGAGFSVDGPETVTFGSSFVDNLRLQQRLKFLGFPGADGNSLKIERDLLAASQRGNTLHATRLFNAAVRGTPQTRPTDVADITLSETVDRRFINSKAAPRWQQLTPVSGNVNFLAPPAATCTALGQPATCQNPELWGTNWAAEILASAADFMPPAGAGALDFLYASLKSGGETAMPEGILREARAYAVYDAGRQLAFDVPSDEELANPFFKTRTIEGQRYAVAKTTAHPTGDEHIIHRIRGAWHTGGELSSTFTIASADGELDTLVQSIAAGLPAVAITFDAQGQRRQSAVVAVDVSGNTVTLTDSFLVYGPNPSTFVIAFAAPNSAPRDTAWRVSTVTADATPRSTLQAMAHLFVDNPDLNGDGNPNDPYSVAAVIEQMQRLAKLHTPSGAKVTSYYFNDPRAWNRTDINVGFRVGHFGHFTATVSPPPTTPAIPNDVNTKVRSFLAGLQGFGEMTNSPLAEETIPGLSGKTLGDFVNPGESLQTNLVNPTNAYFDSTSNPDVDGFLGALDTGAGLDALTTGFRQDGSQLLFDISFRDQTTFNSIPIDLGFGGSSLAAGLDVNLSVDVIGELFFDFTFGIDLAAFSDPDEALFIDVRALRASAKILANDLNVALNLGFLDAGIEHGFIEMDVSLDAILQDLNFDGHVSFAELASNSFFDLAALSLTGSLNADLPIVASIGGFSTSTTMPPRILVSDTDIFSGPLPDVSFVNFDQILDFGSFDADSILALLRSLSDRLRSLSGSFNFEIPFTDKRLADALDLGLDFVDTLVDANGNPTFTGAQSLATQLAAGLGLDLSVINPQYDPVTRELTFSIDYSKDLNESSAFAFDADLAPVADITGTGQIAFAGSVDFGLTFGIDVSPVSAVITATADAPSSGNFAGEAIFNLTLGSDAPVEVRFFATGNASLDDLVADINVALATAGLAVTAERDGNKIQLRTTQSTSTPTLRITASGSNAAVTALHLPTDADAFDNVGNHVFIRDQALDACFGLDGDLTAAAQFGFVGISGDLSAAGELDFTFAPAGGARLGILELAQIITNDIAALGTPTLAGSAAFHVDNLAANISGVDLGLPGQIPNGQHQISVIIPDYLGSPPELSLNAALLAGLNDLKDLDFDAVLDALQALGEVLQAMANDGLLGGEIPGVGVSAGDVIGVVNDFLAFVQKLREPTNRVAKLDELRDKLQEVLDEVLPAGTAPTVSLGYLNQALTFDLDFVRSVTTALDLNLDFGTLGPLASLPGSGSLLEVSSTETIPFAGSLSYNLGFGIDLATPTQPRPFISRNTGIGITTMVVAPNVNIDVTALGVLPLFVRAGTVTLDQDGSGPGTGPATFTIGFLPNGPRLYVSDIGQVLSQLQVDVTGGLNLDLPLKFPDPATAIGNLTVAVPDLELLLTEIVAGNINPGTVTVSSPDLNALISSVDLLTVLRGL